jgi:hypothetical protein
MSTSTTTINCHDEKCLKKATGAWLDTETHGVADFCDEHGDEASWIYGSDGFVRIGEPGIRTVTFGS